MKQILILFIIMINLYSCNENNKIINENKRIISFDTISFYLFYDNFKRELHKNSIDEINKHLRYPIRAIYPILFKFSRDCDSVYLSTYENKYFNISISENNIKKYYDVVFNKEVKEAFFETKVEDILKKGIFYDKNKIRYYYTPTCKSDYRLVTYFTYDDKNKIWKIKFGGL